MCKLEIKELLPDEKAENLEDGKLRKPTVSEASNHVKNFSFIRSALGDEKMQMRMSCEAFNYVELKAAGEEKLPFLQIFNQLPAIFTSHNYTSHG